MPKQNFPKYLRLAIWRAYNTKCGYQEIPLDFFDMEIDHIIPERVKLNPKDPNEFEKWKEMYELDDDFEIQGIENLCPSTRDFNLKKRDKGLYDETDAYKRYIIKALIKAKELKPKIEELSKKYKKDFDVKNTITKITDIATIGRFIKDSNVDIKTIIESVEEPINYKIITDLEEKRKYNKILEKYKAFGIQIFNYGEYLEIKDCIRYSYGKKLDEEDFWISVIDDLIDKIDHKSVLKKKLFYEKVFAMFKVGKKLTSIEVELLNYFNSMKYERNLEVLEQSANLFNVFYGEWQRNRVKSKKTNVLDIRKMLSSVIDSKIQNSKTQSRITQLKFRKLMLNLSIKTEDIIENHGTVDNEATQKSWTDRFLNEFNKFTLLIEKPQYFDISQYYDFVKGISKKIAIIENHNDFDNLFEKIIVLKDKYDGNNSSIKDLMERSIRLFESGNYRRAIGQFQKIKIKSFNPDKIYDCIFAFYYIGLCFEQMGLLYASKYYFLTAFYLSNEIDSDYNTKQLTYKCGMDNIAEINFKLNHLKEAIYSTINALMLRGYYSADIIDFQIPDDQISRNINLLFNHILYAYIYEKKYGSKETFDLIVNLLNDFGVLGIIESNIDSLTSDELKLFTNTIKKKENKTLLDIRKDRSYSWQQLGVNWTVKWDGKVITPPISDEFISYIQVILFCLRDIDVSFIEENIIINLSISEDVGYGDIQDGNNHIVKISKNTESNTYYHICNIYGVLCEIIINCAIVSKEQILKEIEPIFKDNYLSNSYQYMWMNSFGSVDID